MLAVLAIASALVGWFEGAYAGLLGESVAQIVSVVAFVLSAASLFPILIRDLNIWRFLPPRYDGVGRLMRYIGPDLGISNSLFWGDDNRLRIDAALFLLWAEDLLKSVEFVGANQDRQRVSAEINVEAFRGSRYGLSVSNKLERNAALAERCLPGVALLKDGANSQNSLGLAMTLPLTTHSTSTYTSGMVSDNDFNAGMLAVPGDDVGSIVFFLIAHDLRCGGESERSIAPKVLEQLLQVCLLQAVLIALGTRNQKRFLVISANSNPKLKKLFRRLQFQERSDLKSADLEDVFANYIHVKNIENARKILRRRWPDLADKIIYTPAVKSEEKSAA